MYEPKIVYKKGAEPTSNAQEYLGPKRTGSAIYAPIISSSRFRGLRNHRPAQFKNLRIYNMRPLNFQKPPRLDAIANRIRQEARRGN